MSQQQEVLVIPGEWHIRYNYSAGRTASKFLLGLKEEKKVYATRCARCGLVMLPPRAYCERCFVAADDWVEVGQEGTVMAATIVPEKFEGLPDPPYAIAYVKLDGASTAMVNFVEGLDLSDIRVAAERLKPGARAKVVFRDQREGRVTDFYYMLA